MRNIDISESDLKILKKRFKNHKSPIIQKRLRILELSFQKKSMKEIAEELNIGRTTLYHFFETWDNASYADKQKILFVNEGRGAKHKLDPVKEILPSLVEKYNKNIKKILQVLEDEYDIQVCSQTLRKYLKKL